MGLGIVVGFTPDEDDEEGAVWFRAQMAIANRLLARHGFPPQEEGSHVPEGESRSSLDGFGYSALHYLRRAAAHRRIDPNWIATPVSDGGDPTQDSALEKAGADRDFHLLVHSDCEGFYLPVDFAPVLFDDRPAPPGIIRGLVQQLLGSAPKPEEMLAGGMLGSSVRLRRELVEVAPALGIDLAEDGTLSDQEAARIDQAVMEETSPLQRELMVWLALYEAARLSIEHKRAIVFC